MDFTPKFQNISEDSGCAFQSLETSTGFCETSSSRYVETPTTSSNALRKRKLSHFSSLEYYNPETPVNSRADLKDLNILSSTLNETRKSLEKCNLGSSLSIVEYDEFEEEKVHKKYKLDESPEFQPKTRSAPSTPTKHLEPELYPKKSQSEHLNHYPYTPVKNNVKLKLGSPERLELLYPNLKHIASPIKLKTPEKLRDFLKKVNSPAKKRLLFKSDETPFRRVDRDPISVFSVKNDFRHIISKIFEYLSVKDLCTVSRVSKTWRRALTLDHKAFPRFYLYSQEFNSNKENIFSDVSLRKKPSSPPSPVRDSFYRVIKIASELQPNQTLHKCMRCMEPAVVQYNISQCQNPNCEYICCLICLSFSTTGPEHFTDKCRSSELVLETKQNRFGLCDISNSGPSQSRYDSSGYLTESDISPISRHSSVKSVAVLTNSNRIENLAFHKKQRRRASLVSVVSSSSTPQIVEVMEPSSPPKVKLVACSKQSKKNLKRLNF